MPATAPTARLVTAEEMAAMPEPDDGARYELVRGVVLRVGEPPSPRHGIIALQLGAAILQHVLPRALGRVWVEGGVITERDPDTVRGPDVAFVRTARIPPGGFGRGFTDVAPDVVAEVVSPDDRASAVTAKVAEYLAAGVRLVWVVDPAPRTVTAYAAGGAARLYGEGDTLDAGDALPGFAVPVAALFDGVARD